MEIGRQGGGESVTTDVLPATTMSSIKINGIRIDAVERGTGAPLLFLHPGIGLDPAAAVLDNLASRARLIAPTHPHDPMTPAPRFPYYGLEHMGLTVDDLEAAVAELRVKGADIAIGPLTRSPGLHLAFVRGPDGIMVELVQR